MDKRWSIYVLKDPRPDGGGHPCGGIRYVGYTANPVKRFRQHLREAADMTKNSHRLHWLRSLFKMGLKPIMDVIETGFGPWEDTEVRWIKEYRARGADLVNGTDGGRGMARPTEETRKSMPVWRKGRKLSPETKAKLSAAAKGRKVSLETRAKQRAFWHKYFESPDARLKRSESHLGLKHSPETRAKMSASARGKPKSRAWRDKIAATLHGRKTKPLSEETRARISAGLKGHLISDETRAKISAAHKAFHARKRTEEAARTCLPIFER